MLNKQLGILLYSIINLFGLNVCYMNTSETCLLIH